MTEHARGRAVAKTHMLFHADSRKTACGRNADSVAVTEGKPTCARCLRVWRDDRFDPHDPASSGAVIG